LPTPEEMLDDRCRRIELDSMVAPKRRALLIAKRGCMLRPTSLD